MDRTDFSNLRAVDAADGYADSDDLPASIGDNSRHREDDVLTLSDEFDPVEEPRLREKTEDRGTPYVSISLEGKGYKPGPVRLIPRALDLAQYEEAPPVIEAVPGVMVEPATVSKSAAVIAAKPEGTAPAKAVSDVKRLSALGEELRIALAAAERFKLADARSRAALYETLGIAFDCALIANAAPEEYVEQIERAGLSFQKRAPLIPLLKLIFGADYDKTRLTEYSQALTYAMRRKLGRGEFAAFLENADGGLKAIVAAERAIKHGRAERQISGGRRPIRSGLATALRDRPALEVAKALRTTEEFTLLLTRRKSGESAEVIGSVPYNARLLEHAARLYLQELRDAKQSKKG